MWNRIWQFLLDDKNQRMLTLIGGGLVVVIGGLWTAFAYFFPAPGLFLPGTRPKTEFAPKAD